MASAPSGVSATPYYTTANVLLNWTVNGPYASQKIERQKGDGTGTITTVVDGLGGTVATYTDATVALDSYYQYRISGTTSGGTAYTSAWVKCHTTPPAPTNFQVVRSSGSCVLTWKNNSTSNQIAYRVAREKPPWGSGTGAGVLGPTAANAQTVTDSAGAGVLGTDEIRYTLWPYFLAGAADFPAPTGTYVTLTVGAVGTAYAPAVTPSAYVLNLATTALGVAVQHNPRDSSAQTSGNLRYRVVGGGAWTTVALGTSASYTVPAGTLANGSDYEFQAQTAGMNGTLGPWSDSAVVSGATTPVAAITSPANGATIGTGTVTVTGTYSDGSGRPQAGYRFRLLVGGNVVAGAEGGGAVLSWTSGALTNATTYTINFQVQNSAGLWSTVASRTFSTLYPPPPAPTVVPSFDVDTGAATLVITNPAPGGGQVAAVSNNIYRDGVLIASGAAINTIYTDPVPPLGSAVSYRVEAVSATPSTAGTTVTVNTTLGERRWVFLNGGDGYSLLGRMREQVAITTSPDRDKSLILFEGRTLPVEYAGQGRTRPFRVSGEVRGTGAVYTTRKAPRINLYPNSRMVSGGWSTGIATRFGTNWSGGFATTGITVIAGSGINTVYRATCTAAETGTQRGIDLAGNPQDPTLTLSRCVGVGDETTVTTSLYVLGTAPRSYQLIYRFANSSDWVGAPTFSTSVAAASSAWVRLSFTAAVPSGATHVAVSVVTAASTPYNYTVGELIQVSCVVVESGTVAGSYFDGTYSPDPALTPSWLGVAGASPSMLSDLSLPLAAVDDPDLIGTWEPFAQLSELPAPLVFRDPLGRRVVCSTSAWSIVHDSQGPEASVGFTVTEVDQT